MMWDKGERINKDNKVRLPAGSILKNGIGGLQVIHTQLIVANMATPPVHQQETGQKAWSIHTGGCHAAIKTDEEAFSKLVWVPRHVQ